MQQNKQNKTKLLRRRFSSIDTASMLNKCQKDEFTQTGKKLVQTEKKGKLREIAHFHSVTLCNAVKG